VLLVLLIALPLGLGAWAFGFEPALVGVHGETLRLPGWPADHAPLRIALLSDLHTGSPWHGLDTLAEIVEQTNALAPDLVLLAGDYVIHGVQGGSFVAPEEIAPVLGRLSAPLGVYAVLGNHDHWLDAERVRAALEAAGIPVLEDSARRIERPGGARDGAARAGGDFWLVGLGDFWEGECDVDGALLQLADDAPALAFMHNPDLFPRLTDRFALVLAGHTHGGQVALPLLGRPIVPSRYGQRYAAGLVAEEGRHLYVTTGLGTSILPVRFGVPPEIALLTLEAAGR
jgi:hypothetical protein